MVAEDPSSISPTLTGLVVPILGGLVAAVPVLFGVWQTNRANFKRLKAEIENDREVKKSEREAELKKGIFLDVISTMATTTQRLSRFSDPNFNPAEPVDLEKFDVSAFAKLHLVASIDLIELSQRYSIGTSGAFFRLIQLRVKLESLKSDREIAHNFYTSSDAEVNRVLQLQNEYNLEGRHDPLKLNTLQGMYGFSATQAQKYAGERTEIDLKIYSEIEVLLRAAAEEVSLVNQLSVPLMVMLREELGMRLDGTAYSDIITQSNAEMVDLLSKFIENFREFIDEEIDKLESEPE